MRLVVRTLGLAVLVTCAFYYAHRAIQFQYYVACKADLLRVVMFNESAMCTHMAGVLKVIEVAYHQAARHVTNQLINMMQAAVQNGMSGSPTPFWGIA